MTNNGILNITLKELLKVLDARANVSIFNAIGERPIKQDKKVYELLVDSDFMKIYGGNDVKGLVSFINVTNILV